MTLNQLHKRLGKLIEQGQGRRQVCIAKDSFQDNRESDGCTILPICAVDTDWIVDADDDGGTAVNKDGTERGRWTVILGGGSYAKAVAQMGRPWPGKVVPIPWDRMGWLIEAIDALDTRMRAPPETQELLRAEFPTSENPSG